MNNLVTSYVVLLAYPLNLHSGSKLCSRALTLRDFVPRLELLAFFADFLGIKGFSEKYENVQNELFQFILEIIFGSIFNIYHSTPFLCCTTGVGSWGANEQF